MCLAFLLILMFSVDVWVSGPGDNSNTCFDVRCGFLSCGILYCMQVSRWIGERLASLYSHKYIPSDRDMPIMADFRNGHEQAMGNKVCSLHLYN